AVSRCACGYVCQYWSRFGVAACVTAFPFVSSRQANPSKIISATGASDMMDRLQQLYKGLGIKTRPTDERAVYIGFSEKGFDVLRFDTATVLNAHLIGSLV